ncbi:uncharacterized protein BDV17DRAFT_288931 [Aspergillus undulatus]|uniref:uncharacterized protein n=1 Tax=Aspergillus undulatus TaxID=1810928 RepID=UPI003CCCB76A
MEDDRGAGFFIYKKTRPSGIIVVQKPGLADMPGRVIVWAVIRAEKVTTEEKKPGGWRYVGTELESELKLLNGIVGKEYKVLESNVFHFVNGANVRNRTKRLLLIPVNGTPKSISGEPLLDDSYYCTEAGQLLFGERWDIILAALAEKET